MSSTRNVYIALGSNLGDRLQNIKNALELIEQKIGLIQLKSPVYESIAQEYSSTKDYLNAVILCQTDKLPVEILEGLKEIEILLGRKKLKNEYEDRPIDLDILVIDNLEYKLSTNQLEIPHPRMFFRNFVMIPLLTIADLTLKKQLNGEINKKTIADFRSELKTFYIFTK